MVALVTGATGFIGSAVVRKLLERGQEVRAFIRAESNPANLEGLRVDRAIGDLLDQSSLRAAMRGVRAVYHIAADYRLWAPCENDLYEANIIGTQNVIEAATDAGARRIVITSSVCTLGTNDDGAPANEESMASDSELIGAYKRSKFLAEQCSLEWIRKGAPIVIVNPSTPIGPRDIKPTPTGRMVRDAGLGRIPAFVNTGLNFVHVDDVASGHILAYDKGRIGEKYILGGYNLSLKSLLWLIADLTGRRPPRVELPRRALFPVALVAEAVARADKCEPLVTINGLRLARKLMYFTSAKAQRELGYSISPLKEALVDALMSFRIDVRRPAVANVCSPSFQAAL